VLWVGGGGVAARAGGAVAGLAERIAAPVVETFAARGLVRSGNVVDAPPHEPEVADLIGSADLMIAVGTAFDAMTTRGWSMPRPPRLLRVDCDAEAASRGYVPDAVLVADAARGVGAIVPRVVPNAAWCAPGEVGSAVRRRLADAPDSAPAWVLVEAVESWPGPVVCDMAVAGYWVGGYARRPAPRLLQYPVGWGTLGYALPAAVGAAAAGAPVLVVVGDGGLAMGYGELATLVQEHLPVTVLVVDDGGYGMLRYDQNRARAPRAGVDLAGPDLLTLAAAFGIPARDVPLDADALAAALAPAAGGGAPAGGPYGPRLVRVGAELIPPRTTSPRWHD